MYIIVRMSIVIHLWKSPCSIDQIHKRIRDGETRICSLNSFGKSWFSLLSLVLGGIGRAQREHEGLILGSGDCFAIASAIDMRW